MKLIKDYIILVNGIIIIIIIQLIIIIKLIKLKFNMFKFLYKIITYIIIRIN